MLMLLLLTACSERDGISLPIMKATAERQVALTNEAESPHCEVNLKVDYVAGESKVAKAINDAVSDWLFYLSDLTMQQAVDSFANQYVRSYVKDFAPLYREDHANTSRRPWYEYRYKLSTETVQRKNCLTYIASIDYYEGGAHGITQKLAINFDTTNGERLTLSDILDEGYEQSLKEKLLKALMDKTNTSRLEQLKEAGYLTTMDIFLPENYILGDDEITFIFNPYEIAPYAMGMTELTVEVDKMK